MSPSPPPPAPRPLASLPSDVIERTRNWAWETFEFGEWYPTAAIAEFLRFELLYSGDTPQQYARRFIARGVEHKDFETARGGRLWRWKIHPAKS